MKNYIQFLNEANISFEDEIESAISSKNINKVKTLLTKTKPIQPLLDDAIAYAGEYGNLEIFKLLHNAGADIHTMEERPIRCAAYKNQLDIVKYCIENNCDYTKKGNFVLRTAVCNNFYEMSKYLIETVKCPVSDNMLPKAGNNIELFKLLVENGANPNNILKEILFDICQSSCDAIMKYMMEKCKIKIDNNSLPYMYEKYSLDFTKWIIVLGVEPDYLISKDNKNKNIEKHIKNYQLQKFVLSKRPDLAKEFIPYASQELKDDPEHKDLFVANDWGLL